MEITKKVFSCFTKRDMQALLDSLGVSMLVAVSAYRQGKSVREPLIRFFSDEESALKAARKWLENVKPAEGQTVQSWASRGIRNLSYVALLEQTDSVPVALHEHAVEGGYYQGRGPAFRDHCKVFSMGMKELVRFFGLTANPPVYCVRCGRRMNPSDRAAYSRQMKAMMSFGITFGFIGDLRGKKFGCAYCKSQEVKRQ